MQSEGYCITEGRERGRKRLPLIEIGVLVLSVVGFVFVLGFEIPSSLRGHDEVEIVVFAKYELPALEGRGQTRYFLVDSANVTYAITDQGYPQNQHIYDSLEESRRFYVETDGRTIYRITRWEEDLVFDQKSIRYADGRWIHNETDIQSRVSSGYPQEPDRIEWTVRTSWTSLRCDMPRYLWDKVRTYTPKVTWEYEDPPVPYRCLVGSAKVYPWRSESYAYIFEIENIDEYNRHHSGNQVIVPPLAQTTLPYTESIPLPSPPLPQKPLIHGICFSPYMDGQSPGDPNNLEPTQIEERLSRVLPLSQWVRTYGVDDGLEVIPLLARAAG
jgi:hypothetical protein